MELCLSVGANILFMKHIYYIYYMHVSRTGMTGSTDLNLSKTEPVLGLIEAETDMHDNILLFTIVRNIEVIQAIYSTNESFSKNHYIVRRKWGQN